MCSQCLRGGLLSPVLEDGGLLPRVCGPLGVRVQLVWFQYVNHGYGGGGDDGCVLEVYFERVQLELADDFGFQS